MIDPIQVQAFQRSLVSPSERLYAVLDGASIPNLAALLHEHRVVHTCLLPGDLEPELAEAAPYLALLPVPSALAELCLTQGLGNHWGILATSRADLRALRMHLRQFLSVWDAGGQPLLFRYYDPRVLRLYLPTCDGAELAALFGPVSAYFAEAEEPDSLLRLTLSADGLGQQTLSLTRPAAPA